MQITKRITANPASWQQLRSNRFHLLPCSLHLTAPRLSLTTSSLFHVSPSKRIKAPVSSVDSFLSVCFSVPPACSLESSLPRVRVRAGRKPQFLLFRCIRADQNPSDLSSKRSTALPSPHEKKTTVCIGLNMHVQNFLHKTTPFFRPIDMRLQRKLRKNANGGTVAEKRTAGDSSQGKKE